VAKTVIATHTNSVGGGAVQRRANGSAMGPVLGRYELLMRIGTGGMGTVWAARLRGSRGFQKIVALKTILPSFSSDPTYERLFLEEARLTAKLRHPNVAQILDLGEDNGLLFLAMEWVEGVSLSELLHTAEECGAEIPLSVAIRIATQAAAGLHAAHELRNAAGELVNLVHRDVSPQNILVSFDGITKVIDFGIAKAMGDGNDDATRSLQVRGKVGYLAPEQIGDGTPDRRADVFALGVVLYVLTTGSHPFEGRGPLATLYNITSEPATPPSAIRKDYPPELEAAVMRCLEKDRSRRFATCDELVWALESSMPADLRATDQDVAVFVRSLAGDLGAQRSRALELVAESTNLGTRQAASPPPPPPPRNAEHSLTSDALPMRSSGARAPRPRNAEHSLTSDALPMRSPAAQPPRRDGGAVGLVTWAAVFAVSLWILFMQWRSEASAVTVEASPHAALPAAARCPTPPPVPSPATFATPAIARPARVQNRSQKP
jgi:serine/threonine-protein kinase